MPKKNVKNGTKLKTQYCKKVKGFFLPKNTFYQENS